MPNLDHLFVDERFLSVHPYTTGSGGTGVLARSDINRQQHGTGIHVRFNEALQDFWDGRDEQDFVYLEFTSAIDFELDIDKFDSPRKTFRIAYIKRVSFTDDDGNEHIFYQSGIYLDQAAISDFLNMIESYLTKYTWQSELADNPKPQYNTLISNIEDIQAATLKSFWQEAEDDFPPFDQEVWWEVWLDNQGLENVIDYLTPSLQPYGVQIGMQWLHFPEHSVGLVKGTAEQLSVSLLYTNRLAELRKPRETAEFFTGLARADQQDWINDLRQRVDNLTEGSTISVCLLDTGINRGHPLLENLVPEHNLDTIIPETGHHDTGDGTAGHGTPMAGLILYGDLVETLANQERIRIYHHLESVKLINPQHVHDPQNYGFVTQEAMDRAEIINFGHKRVYCLAVTSDSVEHGGGPTSWSAAVDQHAFGSVELPNTERLTMVSSGNLTAEQMQNYPLSNRGTSVHESAQAFNAITVGSYTQKDSIDPDQYPGASPLAQRGAMAPSNSTSIGWDNKWPRKPDIVMEGGNYAEQHGALLEPDSLFLLSTAKGGIMNRWLTTFGDTSSATALASRLAAQLYHRYPHLRPETIRALVIHSAEWTPQMLGNGIVNAKNLNEADRIALLKQVGYGVPNLNRASNSAENALTLIAESELKPFKWEDARVKTDEFHLYQLPWPTEALSGLGAATVRLKVTISYFIEPNPGNKRYEEPSNYASHGLRFKMIGRTESPEGFMGRVSRAMQEDGYEKEGSESGWQLGQKCRDKGSIHKDIWEGTAADLATRHIIAVHPVGGWWKTRKKLQRYENSVRYSLVVSIEAPEIEVDIYNPVMQVIETFVPVSIMT